MAISFLNIYSIFQSIFSSVFPSNIILYISSIYHLISIFQSTRLRKPRHCFIKPVPTARIFQSTRLRKPRHSREGRWPSYADFNPRGCVSLDGAIPLIFMVIYHFNPRGYVNLDPILDNCMGDWMLFQSTRLRKPRQQKHSKKHKDLDYKYNFYTNISTYLYMINPQNIYVHNI